jgi:hypothetical protein
MFDMWRALKFASLFISAANSLAPLAAQEAAAPAKAPSAEEIRAATSPGPEHQQLAGYIGAWNVEVRLGNGPNATVYQGAADARMIVGGRFLQIEYQAKGSADATEGLFTIGFDKRHERYVLVAFDNFGTYFVTSQGQREEGSDRIKMYGVDDDPMMKSMGYTKEFAHVLAPRSADEFAIEILMIDTRTPARRELKFMDYKFTRKK